MCFLYRQSISIVYESKFKYIYRYFIKIDRCFCGILQSLPLRKCGLKLSMNVSVLQQEVTSLAEVWIEIAFDMSAAAFELVTSLAEVWIEITSDTFSSLSSTSSLPLRKCGLKFAPPYLGHCSLASLPLRKCGLKSYHSAVRKGL